MTHKRLTIVALAAAMLAVSAPALAGNVSGNAVRLEQLGPKYLLGVACGPHMQYVTLATGTCHRRSRYITLATRTIPVTLRTLDVEELGPKHLLH